MHLARRRHLLALTLAAVVASGCTTFEPVPKDYTGPTAVSRDSGDAESATKARLFAVVQIEGHHVPNAFSASVNASHGRGAMLTTVHPERRIKAAPTRLLLRASQAAGAPIQAMVAQLAGACPASAALRHRGAARCAAPRRAARARRVQETRPAPRSVLRPPGVLR